MLLLRAGSVVCGLPLELAGETMRPLGVEPLPGTEHFVRGVAIVRGRPAPVIDVRILLGAADAVPPTRFVTLKLGERSALLAVDAVIGVRTIEATMPLPRIAGVIAAARIAAVGALDDALLATLNATTIVPDDVWRAMDGR